MSKAGGGVQRVGDKAFGVDGGGRSLNLPGNAQKEPVANVKGC
jgi:hypothetical protein